MPRRDIIKCKKSSEQEGIKACNMLLSIVIKKMINQCEEKLKHKEKKIIKK